MRKKGILLNKNDDNDYYICQTWNAGFSTVIQDTEEEIVISVVFDYDEYRAYIQLQTEHNCYEICLPELPTSMMMSRDVAQKAANSQRLIDTWVENVKESLELNIQNYYKDLKVSVGNTCIYEKLMFWHREDKETNIDYYVGHKYLREHHPDVYEREKLEYEKIGWKEKLE